MIAARHRRWPAIVLAAALAAPAPLPAQGQGAGEDQDAIAELQEQGVDLSGPRLLEFAFYFPSLEGAQRAWNRLAGQGFKGKLEPAGGGRDYFLFARKAVTVDAATLQTMRATFRSLAGENGGRYEGWGMPER
ncbi:MAG TPA: ribonuclease E inhibitor RraB [Burkholderiales bacterium]|nr:ribonuclease E inhibitor RraB [Burkholderiales bacterium]